MKNIKFILYSLLMSLLIVGCDAEKADQEPSTVGSTAYKPTLTITPSVASGNVEEGSEITYTLSTDRVIEFDIYFKATLLSGTTSEDDIELGTVKLARYTNSATLTVGIADDGIPEIDETAVIKIEPDGVDSEFWVLPNNTLPTFNYTIKSIVHPENLVIAAGWDANAADDLDFFIFNQVEGPWDYSASSDNPEIASIWGSDPDGVYFLGFDPYDVTDDVVEYSFIMGSPDGSVQTITGSFDYENRDTTYTTMDFQGTTVYLLVKVVKNGLNYVATPL